MQPATCNPQPEEGRAPKAVIEAGAGRRNRAASCPWARENVLRGFSPVSLSLWLTPITPAFCRRRRASAPERRR